MNGRINDLKVLVEREHNCRAGHIESVVVHERYEGMRVWDGVVETFQLNGHDKAKRAYAWAVPASQGHQTEYRVVLGVPPINSASDAVKAAVLADFKKLVEIGRDILEK